MVSIKRLEANRSNAQKSTGPKTPQGKAKSAQNAISHGLTASRPILSIEDKDEFDCFANDILVWLDPQNPIETLLARRIAILSWRLQRAAVYETLVLDNLLQNQPKSADTDNESKTGTDKTETGTFCSQTSKTGTGTFCRQAGCTCPRFADVADTDDDLGKILAADFQNQQTLTKVQNYETRLERSMLRCLNTLRRIRDSKLVTYSKIQDYLYGAEDLPKPFFKDEQNEPKFPDHLRQRMNPTPQSSPPFQGGVSRSDEGVLPTQHSELSTQNFSPCVIPAQAPIQSSPDPTVSKPNSSGVSEAKPGEYTPNTIPQPRMGLNPTLQNEPISVSNANCENEPIFANLPPNKTRHCRENEPISEQKRGLVRSGASQVVPVPAFVEPPAAQKATDDFDFYPRWDTVVLDLVGYPAAKRRKMTKQEREEAADQVLVNLKDPKQFLLDYNLITEKTKNEPIFPSCHSREGGNPVFSHQL